MDVLSDMGAYRLTFGVCLSLLLIAILFCVFFFFVSLQAYGTCAVWRLTAVRGK